MYNIGEIKKDNLETFSPEIAMQHADNRCSFSIAYCIKYFIDLAGMVYINLPGDIINEGYPLIKDSNHKLNAKKYIVILLRITATKTQA